ncbi:hypothetical protein MNAN1_002566 [Malassezia nana]|uniref:Uncharacterized protein n=1 Tax=Malassezia nana TaxID=180528 RepID=A0AAF0EJL4_9BASI|nr:hypothetical protein MNAN1_002566 [Malassezia nana]
MAALRSDSAYQTLRRLLQAPPANRQHIDLIDRAALYGTIGHYLSAMALVNVVEFATALVTSPALWTAPSESDEDLRDAVERSYGLAQALALAVSERIAVISRAIGPTRPRAAASELGAWLDAVLRGAEAGMAAATPRERLAHLALITGLVQGLAQERRTPAAPALRFRVRRHAQSLEKAWAAALVAVLTPASRWDAEARIEPAVGAAALTLSASVIDVLPDACRQALDDRVWVDAALPMLLHVFELPAELLFQDAHVDAAALVALPPQGPTAVWAERVQAHPLYAHAGPLSRLIAAPLRRIGAACHADELKAVLCEPNRGLFPRLRALSEALDAAWTTCALAGQDSERIAPSTRPLTTQLWQIFKRYLFSVTLLLDAVVGVVVEQCPTYAPVSTAPSTHTGAVPAAYLSVVSEVLYVYAALYWITSSFSLDGFDSYRVVLYSALDVQSRDAQACTELVTGLAHSLLDAAPRAAAQANYAERVHVTYLLLVIEQLVAELPETMIDDVVLPLCRPYLEDTRFQDAFESAHSVVLALYTAHSPCTTALTPFYVELLLARCPAQLSAAQLEAALTTVVGSLSTRSDSLAWWCVEQIDTAGRVAMGEGDAAHAQTLALCLATLLPHVNLVLLRSLLAKVRACILERPAASSERVALVERVHECLGDMDAATRGEAMRWWLQESPLFTAGLPRP